MLRYFIKWFRRSCPFFCYTTSRQPVRKSGSTNPVLEYLESWTLGSHRMIKRAFSPNVEQLEDRLVPAITSSFNASLGQLTVTGDANANTIALISDANGNILLNNVAISGAPKLGTTKSISIKAGGGNDAITVNLPAYAGNATLDGGAGTDGLVEMVNGARKLTNTALTGGGTHSLAGFERFTVNGGAGNDSLDASAFTLAAATLNGDAGDDMLLGGSRADILTGGAGNDTLRGGAGNDTLRGGAGNDSYVFAAASVAETDIVAETASDGSADRLHFSALLASDAVRVDLTSDAALASHGNRTVRTEAAGQAAYFEIAEGGAGNDTLLGNAAANTLNGNAGNDILQGNAGSDTMAGGAGNDAYVFKAATSTEADVVTELANAGTDKLDFSTLPSTAPVSVDLRNDATLASHANRTIMTAAPGQALNFENATGGVGNDSIIGNAGNNNLVGGLGTDTLAGAGGTDALSGEILLNLPPQARDDQVSLNEDTPTTISVLANDTDPENAALTAELVTAPTHGTLNLNADGTFRYLRGNSRRCRGDLQGAVLDYSAALQADPGFAGAHNNRGSIRFARKDFEGAMADYSRAIELNPRNHEALFNRSVLRRTLGDFVAALADCNAALRLSPGNLPALRNRAEIHRNLRDLTDAMADCNEALRLDPGFAEAYNTRGVIRQELGDFQGAIEDYSEAIRTNPQFAQALTNRGTLRCELQDFEGAESDCKAALSISPFVAEFHGNVGAVFHGQKDLSQAVEEYDTALRLDPSLVWVYLLRGNARYHLTDSEGMHADYVAAFERNLELTASLIARHLERAIAADPHHALRSCDEFLERNPGDVMTYAWRGMTLLYLGRDLEAEDDICRFQRAHPEHTAYLNAVARAVKKRAIHRNHVASSSR